MSACIEGATHKRGILFAGITLAGGLKTINVRGEELSDTKAYETVQRRRTVFFTVILATHDRKEALSMSDRLRAGVRTNQAVLLSGGK